MKILERYILRENIKPFLVALVVTTFVMLLDKILDLLNLIIVKKLDLGMILSIFGLSLPFMLALTVPMAILLASIMSFGRLSVDNELVAFKACGINVFRLMRLTVIAAILISAFMIYFNNNILPDTNHQLKNLMIKANYRRPVTAIEPGTFTTMKNYTIFARERIGEELFGLIIYDLESSKFPRHITAARGQIILSNGGNSLTAILYDGQRHERDAVEPQKYQLIDFEKFILNLPDLGYQLNEEGTDFRSDRELSSQAMQEIIQQRRTEIIRVENELMELQSQLAILQADTLVTDRESVARIQNNKREIRRVANAVNVKKDQLQRLAGEINKYQVEIHKKYAIAVACLIFVLIGAPVGMMTRTSSVGMAFSVSSIVFLIYYGTLTLGEELADRGTISPFLAMWIANMIFAVIGIYLVILSVKEMKFINLKGLFNKMSRWLKLK
ncbi:MAG: LptF/LptG family permease [Candidatus Cloacimonetes bacterium]|nr:LptF/LptG family permease [Candidatus Cloacimonadota bacterium]